MDNVHMLRTQRTRKNALKRYIKCYKYETRNYYSDK